jgi:hypothetical protein
MSTRITKAPSPNNTNFSRAFLVHIGRSLGALDSVKKDSVKKHGDEDMPDLAELHVALEELLAESLGESEMEQVRALLDQHLGGAARQYDRGHEAEDEDDQDEEAENVARRRMRGFLAQRGASDADVDELFEMLDREEKPRNGMAGDRRRRMARDLRRQQMASDAAEDRAAASFDRMYPEAARIKMAF